MDSNRLRPLIFMAMVVVILALADVQVDLALIAFAVGTPLLLLGFGHEVRKYIDDHYPHSYDITNVPRTQNELVKEVKTVERPYFWLANSTKLFFISAVPFFVQFLVDEYKIPQPEANLNPFQLTGLVLMAVGVYCIARLSFFLVSEDPVVDTIQTTIRYSFVVLIPLSDILTLDKFSYWTTNLLTQNITSQVLWFLLIVDYFCSVYFVYRLAFIKSIYSLRVYTPVVFVVLPWVLSLLLLKSPLF